MTAQFSRIEALELTISIIDDLKDHVRDETFESYLNGQRKHFQEITDKAKREKNYVIARVVFIQAHSVLKSYENAMSKLIEVYRDSMGSNTFYRYATAMILKSQLWRLYHEAQEQF